MLVIGAHPDDEDTELLTVLTRHDGAEAAYLSLNRGEGGQNLIGPELGEALGILRTEELLAARRLDGAQQFFTRAYDFGFSKSLDDTWAHWPRDSVLKDVLRVVRAFRPQVIVSVFSGTPRDGHGQHMAAGWAAREAFKVAGDSTAFPELAREEGLAPWVPHKLYLSTRFDTAATTLRLDGGVVDEATGKTYRQTAMESRSLHRSQDMGQLQGIGPSTVRLALLESRTGVPDRGLWAGIDTSMTRLLEPAPARTFLDLVDQVRHGDAGGQGARLQAADSILAAARGTMAAELRDQRSHVAAAWQAATGTLFDARTDRADAPDRSEVQGTCEVRSSTPEALVPCRVAFQGGGGAWAVDSTRAGPGWGAWFGRLDVRGVEVTQPYYLRQARDGAMYRWVLGGAATRGMPFEPRAFTAELTWTTPSAGAAVLAREFSYRWNDQSSGERRAPVEVVPALDVAMSPSMVPWRLGGAARPALTVTLHNVGADSLHGRLHLEVPAGWPAVRDTTVVLAPGERRVVPMAITAPPGLRESRAIIGAVVEVPDAAGTSLAYRYSRRVVSYPHIERRGYLEPAETVVSAMELRLPSVGRVGYVRGAGDRIPEALQAAGFDVEVIPGAALGGSLARFGAVVIGPRAYEVDSALVEHNDRLLAWARSGGRVIVQYQQYGFFFDQLSPFPLYVASRLPGSGAAPTVTSARAASGTIGAALLGGHDRVTDEAAAVRVVNASDPVLSVPNRIGPRDWDGWVQERGLYFARAWAPDYRTVVAMHDAGEAPLEGGLLIARVGKGSYTYTGLSFFRQLPAGVPGAFRLFANLLAVGGQ